MIKIDDFRCDNDEIDKEKVLTYMEENNYTGLYCPEADSCGCEINDLFPCGLNGEDLSGCRFGYKHKIDSEKELESLDLTFDSNSVLSVGDFYISYYKEKRYKKDSKNDER